MLDEDIQEEYHYNNVDEVQELLVNAKNLNKVHSVHFYGHFYGEMWLKACVAEGLDVDEDETTSRFCYKRQVKKGKLS